MPLVSFPLPSPQSLHAFKKSFNAAFASTNFLAAIFAVFVLKATALGFAINKFQFVFQAAFLSRNAV